MPLSVFKKVIRKRIGQDRLLDFACKPRELLTAPFSWLRSIPEPSQVAIVSMWDERQADLAAITSPNKAAYCARWGYQWLPFTAGFVKERPVAWSKLHFIAEALKTHEWVFWSDADSLITNPDRSLAEFMRTSADLVITRDLVGFNSGSFLIRRSEWSATFLQEAWDFPSTTEYRAEYTIETDRLWENRAIVMLLRHYRHRRHTQVVTQHRLNAYLPELNEVAPSGVFRPGDFVLHLPGVSHEIRLKELAARA